MTHGKAILKILAKNGPMDLPSPFKKAPVKNMVVLRTVMSRLYRDGRVRRVGPGVYGIGPLAADLKALQKLCEAQEKEIARLKEVLHAD
jgi:hypothetical protein